ncbi:MAG: hypothetical protein U0414_10405 [Polyangiaceae bacterium]
MDLDILDATEDYADARGYHYVGMSESWKRMCLDLPCSKRVQIPLFYKEQHIDTTIDGEAVVVQAWRGNCPKAFRGMPGGIGGEVGVYRRMPGRRIPDTLDLPRVKDFPEFTRPIVTAIVSRLVKEAVDLAEADAEWWWPYPEIGAGIDMRLLRPDSGDVFFEADPAEPPGGYWMSRWMNPLSYRRYVLHELERGLDAPEHAYDYRMEFTVKGARFRWDAVDAPIVRV